MVVSKRFKKIERILEELEKELYFLNHLNFLKNERFFEFLYYGDGFWNYSEEGIVKLSDNIKYIELLQNVNSVLGQIYKEQEYSYKEIEYWMNIPINLMKLHFDYDKLIIRTNGDPCHWAFNTDEIRSNGTSFGENIEIIERDIVEYLKKSEMTLRERLKMMYKGNYEWHYEYFGVPTPKLT